MFWLIFIYIWTNKLEVAHGKTVALASTVHVCIHNSIWKIMFVDNFEKQ
jgi:hypothetical protein